MCVKPIEAFEDSKGNMFKSERCAIESEIGIITGFVANDVLTLIAKASPLVPLLQRALSIAPPTVPKDKAPVADAIRTPAAGRQRCATEEEHQWQTDPKNSLIDVCLRCGEERA